MNSVKLEAWAGANIVKIVDAGQEGCPLVCQVPRAAHETHGQVLARGQALAELIEIGWKVKYGVSE